MPGQAVLARVVAAHAASFQEDDPRLDVLKVAMPRAAWVSDPQYGNLLPGTAAGGLEPPFPAFVCAGFPRNGLLLTTRDGAGLSRVIAIENSGSRRMTIDPAAFVIAYRTFDETPAPPDLAPAEVSWEDDGTAAPRRLAPGEQALLRVGFAEADLPPRAFGALVFRDPALVDGTLELDGCINGGCGGGGSRPRLRLSR